MPDRTLDGLPVFITRTVNSTLLGDSNFDLWIYPRKQSIAIYKRSILCLQVYFCSLATVSSIA
jgi:hypothetical protein